MDEFGSPLSGGIRAVRRNISSSFLGAPRQAKADPVTTSLLQQQSLQLTSVSGQLQNISRQVSVLDFNLKAVKENLALNEQLERQREAANQNRERILAEQGLREGKESALENKIQSSLTQPVQRIGVKTQGILGRLTNFLFTLAGGWLTITGIDLLQAMSEGNVDKINRLKTKFIVGLTVIVGSFTAISVGIKKVIGILGVFAGNVARVAFGGMLRVGLKGVQALLAGLVKKAAGLGLGFFGGAGLKSIIGQIVATVVGIKLGKFIPGFNKVTTAAKVATGARIATPALKPAPTRKFLPNLTKNIKKVFSKGKVPATIGAGAGGTAVLSSSADDVGVKATEKLTKKFSKDISSKVTTGTGKEITKKSGFLSKLKGLKNLGVGKLFSKLLNIFGPLITFFTELTSEDGGLVSAAAATAGFLAGAALGQALIPIPVVGAIVGGILGEEAFKRLSKTLMKAFGVNDIKLFNKKVGDTLTDEDFTSSNDSITPTKNNNTEVANQISNFDEDAPQVVNMNTGNKNNQSSGAQSDPSGKSVTLPAIEFDNNNPHTMYATALTGVS